MSEPLRIRAGHDDRSRVSEQLAVAYSEGKLDHVEFEERSADLMAARYLDQLDSLVADLGVPTTSATSLVPLQQTQSGSALAMQRDPGATSTDLSIGIVGGTERAGSWVVGSRHTSVAFWGGTELDLREVVHTSDEIVINAWAVMGGTEIIVAPDADVSIEGFGLMGGFGWDNRKSARTPTGTRGPRIIIRGLAFWGGVGVVRKALDET